jgi:hypothetical protein
MHRRAVIGINDQRLQCARRLQCILVIPGCCHELTQARTSLTCCCSSSFLAARLLEKLR